MMPRAASYPRAGVGAMVLLAGLCAWLPAQAAAGPDLPAERQLIVTLHLPKADPPAAPSGRMAYLPPNPEQLRRQAARQAAGLAGQLPVRIDDQWPIHALGVNCLLVELDDDADREAVIAALRRMPLVDAVQPLNIFQSATAAAGRPDGEPAPAGRPTAQGTGKGVSIAVIDTGADLGHEAFQRRDVQVQDLVDASRSAPPPEQHGTVILGLLLANPNDRLGVAGLAPDASVSLFRACWESGGGGGARCNTFTLAKALAAALHADSDIVNLSINGPRDPLLERLGDKLVEAGSIVVAAGHARDEFPGSIRGSLLAAEWPGSGQAVLTPLPGNRYGMNKGSSVDAALLAAFAAKMRESHGELSADQLSRSAAGVKMH